MLGQYSIIENGEGGCLRKIKTAMKADMYDKYSHFFPIASEKIMDNISDMLQIINTKNYDFDNLSKIDSMLDMCIGFTNTLSETMCDLKYYDNIDEPRIMSIKENNRKLIMMNKDRLRLENFSVTFNRVISIYSKNKYNIIDAINNKSYRIPNFLTTSDIEFRSLIGKTFDDIPLVSFFPDMVNYNGVGEDKIGRYPKKEDPVLLKGEHLLYIEPVIDHPDNKKLEFLNCGDFVHMKKLLYSYYCAFDYDPENQTYSINGGDADLQDMLFQIINHITLICMAACIFIDIIDNTKKNCNALEQLLASI